MTDITTKENDYYMLLEIPEGETNKYEYNSKINKLVVDRINPFAAPFSYGSLWSFNDENKTLSEDGDELDVVCIGKTAVVGSLIPIRVIGIIKINDNNEEDNKILAVNSADKNLKNIFNIHNLDEEQKNKIIFFFNNYKDWEATITNEKTIKKRKIIFNGFGDYEEAFNEIEKCKKRYKKENKK